MNLHQLFAQTHETKIASEGTPATPATPAATARPNPGGASAAVQAAVNEALSGTTKVASEADATPSASLTKLAEQVAGLEKQARIQEAHLIGRAHCDGFMAQLAVYEKVAAQHAPDPQYAQLAEKQAAEAAWAAEYNETVGQIQKLAADHYICGHEMAREALS